MLVTVAVMFLVLSVAARAMIVNSFEAHEVDYATETLNRTMYIMWLEIDAMDMMVKDWSAWDDAYYFIDNRNTEFIDSNLGDSTFSNIRLNLMLFISSDGSLAFGKAYDSNLDAAMPESESFIASVMNHSILFDIPDRDGGVAGIVSTPRGALMVSSRPIQNSEKTLPLNGFLVMGRLLDDEIESHISEVAHVETCFHSLNTSLPTDVEYAISVMDARNETELIHTPDDDIIAGYAIVYDIDGLPAMVLAVYMQRTIYNQGMALLNLFLVFLLAVMAIMGAVTLIILECSIVQRITDMNTQVNSICADPERSARLDVRGNDEISSLAANINAMLDIREKSETVQAELNRALESRLAELERYKKATVDRELKLVELKERVRHLEQNGGVPR